MPNTGIKQLLEPAFIKELLPPVLAAYYKGFEKLTDLTLTVYKQHYRDRHHWRFVIGCQLDLVINHQNQKELVVIGASSDGSKKIAYDNLKLLRSLGFDHGPLQVTAPIAYLPHLQAVIYEGVAGQPLYHYLEKQPTMGEMLKPLELASSWLRKLHALSPQTFPAEAIRGYDFQVIIKYLQGFIPTFQKFSTRQGQKLGDALNKIQKYEQQLRLEPPHLVYGDYHPENIILSSLDSPLLTMIDLTDLSLGDRYRDIGTFLQQFDFMSQRFLARPDINNLKKHFVSGYFKESFHLLDAPDMMRINLFQALTAVRSSVWMFDYSYGRRASLEVLNDSLLYLEKIERHEVSINLR